jgi:hypothetical protein
MSIITRWENNEKTIISVQFANEWSWDEFAPIREAILEMQADIPHVVDYIADFCEVDDIPTGALAVGRSIHRSCTRNDGIMVLVGTSPMLRMLFQSFITAYPVNKNELVLVSTLDEAFQIITDIQQNRNNN